MNLAPYLPEVNPPHKKAASAANSSISALIRSYVSGPDFPSFAPGSSRGKRFISAAVPVKPKLRDNPLKVVVNQVKSSIGNEDIDHDCFSPFDNILTNRRKTIKTRKLYYKDHNMLKDAEQLDECAKHIEFAHWKSGDVTVNKIYFCKHRFCPICNGRRAKRLSENFVQYWQKEIMSKMDNPRLVFLTLTQKNFQVSKTRKWLQQASKALRDFRRTKDYKNSFLGMVQAFEITRGKDGLAHGHVHAVLLVDGNMYTPTSLSYFPHSDLVRMWKHYMKLDYNPIIDVRFAKPKDNSNLPQNDISDAVKELLKYIVKPDDLIDETNLSDPFLAILTQQLRGLHTISGSGMLRSAIKDIDDIDFDAEEIESGDEIIGFTYATWSDEHNAYKMRIDNETGKTYFVPVVSIPDPPW